MKTSCSLAILAAIAATSTRAAILTFGDVDVLNTGGTYSSTPTDGASLTGLAPGSSTFGTGVYGHNYPFAPSVGDFPGTDAIYVGSGQSGGHDGYSGAAERVAGPLVLSLDYSAAVPSGEQATGLTLGLMLSDFQFPSFGQPFTAKLNGVTDATLTGLLNGIDQGGPVAQFLSYGVAASKLAGNQVLTVEIDQGGDGGDGWAVDFATVGVSSALIPVPEPGEWMALAGAGLLGFGLLRRARNRRA